MAGVEFMGQRCQRLLVRILKLADRGHGTADADGGFQPQIFPDAADNLLTQAGGRL
ncbi:hypothetical protein D3C73_1028340 [compost metagenome]